MLSASKLSDDELLKRAGHAGRNLRALAILCVFGVFLYAMVIPMVAHEGEASRWLLMIPVGALLMAGGWWILSISARGGNPRPVTVGIAVAGLQVLLGAGLGLLNGIGRLAEATPMIVGRLAIPFLVIFLLALNRSQLLEIRSRGLSEKAFEGKSPGRWLPVVGGILLVLGFVAFNTSVVGTALGSVRQEKSLAREFITLIKEDERKFMNAMSKPTAASSVEDMESIVDTLDSLKRKTKSLHERCKEYSTLEEITGTYLQAVREWEKGIDTLSAIQPDRSEFESRVQAGDRLRSRAMKRFQKRYMNGGS